MRDIQPSHQIITTTQLLLGHGCLTWFDDSFLRHSKRLSKKAKGYKDAKTAKEAKKSVEVDDEPMPLAVIPPPGNAAAPHLSQKILQGIGQGFLKI